MSASSPRIAVVGAGATGLATAALLAADGARVTLIDRLPRIGGLAAARTLDGLRFSPGPQYLWGFGEGGAGRRVLDRIGCALPMHTMPEGFDLLAVGDGRFEPVHRAACWPLLAPALGDDPEKTAAARRLLDDLDLLGRASEVISEGARYMDGGAAMAGAVLRARGLPLQAGRLVARHRGDSVARFAERYGISPQALRIVAFHQGICAERLDVLSVVFFAAVRHVLSGRLFVPAGGACRLVDALAARARALGVRIRLGAAARRVRREGPHIEVACAGRAPELFDRVVLACPPPVAAALCRGVDVTYARGGAVVALCLSVELDPAARRRLAGRNFTWYRGADPVCFDGGAGTLDYLNYGSPTLNGPDGADGGRAIICAFYPGRLDRQGLAAAAERRIVADLSRHGHARVRARQVIDQTGWDTDHGAHRGAIYGRRLDAGSIRRKAVVRTPPGVTLAHSAVGVPGILGCVEMAERTADTVLADWRARRPLRVAT